MTRLTLDFAQPFFPKHRACPRQARHDRADRHLGDRGDLAIGKVLHLAQNQNLAKLVRQGRDHGIELDVLERLVHRHDLRIIRGEILRRAQVVPNRELRLIRISSRVGGLLVEMCGALRRIAALRPMVDMFFEEVLVIGPDEGLTQNRFALLKMVGDLFARIADFTKING